jgi:hypothetical protein
MPTVSAVSGREKDLGNMQIIIAIALRSFLRHIFFNS